MKSFSEYLYENIVNEAKEPKYELVGQEGKFWRIRALKDFECVDGTKVKAGDIGGLIQSEDNLSQEGNCWVAEYATVSGKAQVFDNAKIGGGMVSVSGHAKVYGDAFVDGASEVTGWAEVYDNAVLSGSVKITGHSKVHGNAQVYGYAIVRDNAEVTDDSRVGGPALVIKGNAKITGTSNLFGRYNVDWDIDSEDINQSQWVKHDPKLMNK